MHFKRRGLQARLRWHRKFQKQLDCAFELGRFRHPAGLILVVHPYGLLGLSSGQFLDSSTDELSASGLED